jgi:hypothetical protein
MKTITWRKGEDRYLDDLFESLRLKQYNNKEHRYWSNYDLSHFKFSVAYTIHFDDDEHPESCSVISNRSCWPTDVYRILTRTWKIKENRKTFLRTVSDCMGYSALSQIKWLEQNTDYRLYFISRQTNNWNSWMKKHFNEKFGIQFELDQRRFKTCDDDNSDSCFQNIIYSGSKNILEGWPCL